MSKVDFDKLTPREIVRLALSMVMPAKTRDVTHKEDGTIAYKYEGKLFTQGEWETLHNVEQSARLVAFDALTDEEFERYLRSNNLDGILSKKKRSPNVK